MILVLSIVTLLISGISIYLYNDATIPSPKMTSPSHKYKNSLTSREVAAQMLKDMYPNDEVEYKLDGYVPEKDCRKKWCIAVLSKTEHISLIVRVDGDAYDPEKSVEIGVKKYVNDIDFLKQSVERNKEFYDTYIKEKYPNARGKDYWFSIANSSFKLDNSAGGYDKSTNYNKEPIGFKKSLPFKEYFEKIEFED